MASLPIIPATLRPARAPIGLFSNHRSRNPTVRAAATKGARYEGTRRRERYLAEMIEKKVEEAMEVCEGKPEADVCRVAWDEVEELSKAMADLRWKLGQSKDPLEWFCVENPESEECRVLDD
ncbi:hypothetical protein QJS04_geneDACA012078 [Acorus gramineus]|uniref:CP12 domain-containing protein n=1 Tax=Acorus gramineus TaxID=55184 RepID=A0AAV9B9G1_ACOGR|nr:hypothetical protein QJS04_geneDACA012078 [Acorus gramineus]